MEKLERRYNGASAIDFVYFGDHFIEGYEDDMALLNN